jgi:SET domain
MKIKVLNNFVVSKNHLGKAVFAARVFKKGDVITQFTGPRIHKSEIPTEYKGEEDRYVQITKDYYLGPSGDIDDLINHSCDPNSGFKFTNSGVLLVALRQIEVGDEITWDYSTTLLDSTWKMMCECNSEICRKIIGDFMLLDAEVQNKYKDLDILPQYVLEYMNGPVYDMYTKGIGSLKHGKQN